MRLGTLRAPPCSQSGLASSGTYRHSHVVLCAYTLFERDAAKAHAERKSLSKVVRDGYQRLRALAYTLSIELQKRARRPERLGWGR